MIRKFLSWLLVLAMVCTMLPAQALAAATNKETTALETLYVARVNPLYADEITEADLNEPANVMPLSDPEYLSDPEEAGAYLREGMKVREETVAVGFLSDGFSQEIVDTLSEEFIDAALAHTGVPTEGDYLAWQYYGWKCTVSGSTDGTDYYLTFTYALTYYTDVEQEAAMDTAIADLLTDLNPSGTDYEKVKAVYDWICDNVTYDYDNLEDDTYRLKHTAYAALINRTAVCQGYAVLLYRLALEMGIDIRLIPGDSDGDGESDHAWNIVELGDLYYNADPTWDTNYAESDNYQYFLVTDDNFTSHTRDAEYATEAFYAAYPMGQTDYDPEADSGSDIAASGTCGESLTWVLTSDGILTISGEGAMYDYDMTEEQRAPWYEHRASITAIVAQYTKIVKEAGALTDFASGRLPFGRNCDMIM